MSDGRNAFHHEKTPGHLMGCGFSKPGKARSRGLNPNRPKQTRRRDHSPGLSIDDQEDEVEDEAWPRHPDPPPTTELPNYLQEFGAEYPRASTRVVSPCRKITNSVAFVKDSEDPYKDFRRSMLQMIFDREIRSREDLQELLNCFLQLNSPSHHDAIIRAFTEIWNSVFPDKNKAVLHDQ